MSPIMPWQVYHANGTPLPGVGLQPADFTDNLIMGAAHVWVWRKRQDGEIEVLAQKRATTKVSWPSYYDISTAGHIDVGETPVESAVREAREEIGLMVDSEQLLYLFSLRTPLVPNELDHVFLYETTSEFTPTFIDGEVELVQWYTVDELRKRVADPEAYHFVDQGQEYFAFLLGHLEQL